MLTNVTGAILAAVVVSAYLKYKPGVRTYSFQTLAVTAATAVLSMAVPLSGVFQWLGLTVQLVLLGCVWSVARRYRKRRAAGIIRRQCRALGQRLEQDRAIDLLLYAAGVEAGQRRRIGAAKPNTDR